MPVAILVRFVAVVRVAVVVVMAVVVIVEIVKCNNSFPALPSITPFPSHGCAPTSTAPRITAMF